MSLNDKVAADITAAMKAKDAARLSALRIETSCSADGPPKSTATLMTFPLMARS